jgi:hypothetical protein
MTEAAYLLALHMKRATYSRHENHEQLDPDLIKGFPASIPPPQVPPLLVEAIPTLTERVNKE